MRYDFSAASMQQLVRLWKNGIALFALSLLPAISGAHPHSAAECAEGGDFIGNAARARDNGVSEADFIGRIQDDIEAIQALPPQVRWFVEDDEDAQFLLAAATDVFRNPKETHAHRADFIKACLRRSGVESWSRRFPSASSPRFG